MYSLKLDYATFNFNQGVMDISHVMDNLCPGVDFVWSEMGSNSGNYHSPLGLYWKENNGFAARPHTLQVSGCGCTHFACTLPNLRLPDQSHFSRLDFAFDVIVSDAEWSDFICAAFADSMHSDRKSKKFQLAGKDKSWTVYIGSRRSPYFFRIYNKSLEDPYYKYYNSDGDIVDVPDGYFVIRYEVELKRFTRTRNGNKEVFDPSSLFDLYYSDDPSQLFSYIKKLWLSYGNDILLPADFANCTFNRTLDKQNAYFVQKTASDIEIFDIVKKELHDLPQSFDRTLHYLVSRFGKYIPYIVKESELMSTCMSAARCNFGFEDHLTVYFEDQYDLSDPDPDIPWLSPPDCQCYIDNYTIGGFE